MGNDDTGVAACEGVVPAEAGVDASYKCTVSTSPSIQAAQQAVVSSTYPEETRRASTEYSVYIADLSFAPCSRAGSASRRCRRRTLDVVIEALDYVSCAGLLKVLCLNSEYVIFELLLHK